MALRLYTYWRSSAAYRVRIALAVKGLQYEAVPRHLLREGGEQRRPEYLELNPQGLVPALEHDGHVVTQSLAICEYLEETHPLPPLLPADRPRYLMGVGKPEDLLGAVARGIDLFDCVLPTRSGRTGQAFTRFGPVNLRNARHADDPRPLDDSVPCPASREFSRAYLHHLVRSGEILGAMLLTWHNLSYYADLMAGMRAAIAAGGFSTFAAHVRADWAQGDIEPWSILPEVAQQRDGAEA